jgi:hypothetical protein
MNYVMVPQKQEALPLFPPRTAVSRPASEATEIFEDDDGYSGCNDESPMRSVASVSSHFVLWVLVCLVPR